MTFTNFKWISFLTVLICVSEGGILKGRRKNNDNEGVETLLAVGLIAKALSDIDDKPSESHCPPMVTRYIHVPVYTERVIVVKEKSHEGLKHDWADNNGSWKREDKDKEENKT